MNANEYQTRSARTLRDKPIDSLTAKQWMLIFNSVAVFISSGSICEQLKKGIFHQHGVDSGKLAVRHQILSARVRHFYTDFLDDMLPKYTDLSNQSMMITWCLVGLIGEAAEIAELIFEGLHKGSFDLQKLGKELGDIMWYAAGLCSKLGLNLGDVMEDNIHKLEIRYPNGFDPEDSQKRIDVQTGV